MRTQAFEDTEVQEDYALQKSPVSLLLEVWSLKKVGSIACTVDRVELLYSVTGTAVHLKLPKNRRNKQLNKQKVMILAVMYFL